MNKNKQRPPKRLVNVCEHALKPMLASPKPISITWEELIGKK